jgi:hypothetical protein
MGRSIIGKIKCLDVWLATSQGREASTVGSE